MITTNQTKKYRKFWYRAIGTTPASAHVHFDRVMKGESYLIAKTDDPDFVSITGKLFCKSGGFDRVIDKHVHISKIKPFVVFQDVSECLNICPNA